SPGLQEDFVRQTLKELDQAEQEMNKLITAWTSGDTKTLEAILESDPYPEIRDRLVTERNRNWVPKIEEFLQQDANYLVVVGALHLVGKDGVIERLRAKGYVPEQMLAGPATPVAVSSSLDPAIKPDGPKSAGVYEIRLHRPAKVGDCAKVSRVVQETTTTQIRTADQRVKKETQPTRI